MSRNYILIIDVTPPPKAFVDYFAQFDFSVVFQQELNLKLPDQQLPAAILIQWDMISTSLNLLDSYFKNYPVPLIICSDTPNEEACILALGHGSDDFLVKPILARELLARIGSIRRRIDKYLAKNAPGKECYLFENWRLYPMSRKVLNGSNEVLSLSNGEYDLLYTFVQHPQTILDREQLLNNTRNAELAPFDRRIDVQISRLRHKIEVDSKKPALIKTIRNGGYMFTASVKVFKEE